MPLALHFAGAIVLGQISYAKKNTISLMSLQKEKLENNRLYLFEVSLCAYGYCSVSCVFADFNGIIAGYFVVGGIFLLTILRAIIFAVIDKKGL